MYEGYFSSDLLILLTVMKSTLTQLDLTFQVMHVMIFFIILSSVNSLIIISKIFYMTNFKDADSDDWAIYIATKTIQTLLEIEKKILHPKKSIVTTLCVIL